RTDTAAKDTPPSEILAAVKASACSGSPKKRPKVMSVGARMAGSKLMSMSKAPTDGGRPPPKPETTTSTTTICPTGTVGEEETSSTASLAQTGPDTISPQHPPMIIAASLFMTASRPSPGVNSPLTVGICTSQCADARVVDGDGSITVEIKRVGRTYW